MIRQAISCDICGSEKKQTNHWFVAYDQGGELRIGGWSSKNRLRPGAQHLCGQTCLHKLVDEFMARCISARPSASAAESGTEEPGSSATDTSLTSGAAYLGENFESSARLISPPAPAAVSAPPERAIPPGPPRLPLRPPVELVPAASRIAAEVPLSGTGDSPAQMNARSWRAEAWERERERELRAVEHRPDIAQRRRLSR